MRWRDPDPVTGRRYGAFGAFLRWPLRFVRSDDPRRVASAPHMGARRIPGARPHGCSLESYESTVQKTSLGNAHRGDPCCSLRATDGSASMPACDDWKRSDTA